MPEGNNNVNGGQTVTPRVAAQEAYIKNLMTGSENVPGMTEEQARAIANSNNDLFENWAMNHGFAEAFEETKIHIEDPFVPATEAFVRNLMTGSEGVPAISEIQARAIAADRGAVETWARNHGFAEAFDNFAKQNEQKDTLENARKAYIESLKSAGMSEEDAIKFANLDRNQDLFENWARNNGFAEAFDKAEDTKLADAKEAYIESLKSAGMSEEDAIKFANLDRNQDLFENWARNNGFDNIFDKVEDKGNSMLDEFDPTHALPSGVEPSTLADSLYAGGSNPNFKTIEDAMAFVAAHPELEEPWKKDNEVQDKSKDEFDPSHALPAGDEAGFDPSHALPAGDQPELVDDPDVEEVQSVNRRKGPKDLINFFKDKWENSNTFKAVVIAAGLVIAGLAIFAATALTGDASHATYGGGLLSGAASNADFSSLSQVVSDPTVAQSFDLSGIGQGTEVHQTIADAANGTNTLLGNEWMQVDHLEAVDLSGNIINLDDASPEEILNLANSNEVQFRGSNDGTYMGWFDSNTIGNIAQQQVGSVPQETVIQAVNNGGPTR